MYLRSRRPAIALSSLAVLAAVGLSACGGDSDDTEAGDDTPSETTEATTETEAPVETESEPAEPVETTTESVEETSAPTSAEGQPSWALPVTTPGDLLTTVEAGDVSVEIYQVGMAKADDTGSFVDPDTNKPLIEVGDTLVFVNYVVTNNGAPIDLGSSLVTVSARYDDWPYLQGMDGLVGEELFEAQGVNDGDLAPDGFNEAGIYTLGTGESFSFGENFEYQKNSPIGFEVEYVPVDAEGELIFDDRVEAEGTATIK